MKFSYHWLQELSQTKKSPAELAEFLTLRAFEVESVDPIGFRNDRVVIGDVIELAPHPNADRLRVATVCIGIETLSIVCGAHNIAQGQKVAVALEGAVLPGNFIIEKTKIRNVESCGMICSQRELDTGTDHEGIWVLPTNAEVGLLLENFLNTADVLLDIKVLPDRAHDCLSHVGMAREIVALEGRTFDYDYDGLLLPDIRKNPSSIRVALDAEQRSMRYVVALVRDARIVSSPAWIRDRLAKFGMRSINAVVDATNLIMLEIGQPMHAFDWEKLSGGEVKTIGPRMAKSGEKITLLDGNEYVLTVDDMVIADDNRAVALAGIMGGADSAIDDSTTDILFESAHFDATSIRRTRTRLGIMTDASSRFEKSIAPDLSGRALVRLLEIVAHTVGGTVESIIDTRKSYTESAPIVFLPKDVSLLLGTDVSRADIERFLTLRGCTVSSEDGEKMTVTPPVFRLDIHSMADIAEEIGKSIGYDTISSISPHFLLTSKDDHAIYQLEYAIKNFAVANGFIETLNYSFYSQKDADAIRCATGKAFVLENPMNPDQTCVRRTLLVGLLKNISANRRRFGDIRLFECGNVYESVDGVVQESKFFSGAFFLSNHTGGDAFFLLKAFFVRLLESLAVSCTFLPYESEAVSAWHPTRTATIVDVKGNTLGVIGEAHPSVAKAFGVVGSVAMFECNAQEILEALPKETFFTPLSKYPETLRDLSFFFPERTLISDIEKSMYSAGEGAVVGVEVFDRYRGDERGKSLAFHIRLNKESATLSGEEADVIMANIIRAVEFDFGATLRKA